MKTAIHPEPSLFELLRDFRDEMKTFIKQEVELVKTEMSEKVSRLKRNTILLAIGGLVAYAGAIVFLIGLGFLLALAFQSMGLNQVLAYFLGQAVIGLVIAGVGYAFVAKAIKGFSQETLVPEKTLETLQTEEAQLQSAAAANTSAQTQEPERTSEEVQSSVQITQGMMEETAGEIRERLTPRHIRQTIVTGIKEHPVRLGVIGIMTGLAGFVFFKLKRRGV